MGKGWLSPKDFEQLDTLFGKLGYGGYYDFLECLKMIGNKIGAFSATEIDGQDLKTVSDVIGVILAWSESIYRFRMKTDFQFVNRVLQKSKEPQE